MDLEIHNCMAGCVTSWLQILLRNVQPMCRREKMLIAAGQRGAKRRANPLRSAHCKAEYRQKAFLLDASGCFLGSRAPKRDNRFGNKLPLLRFARQVGNVPLAALLGLETVALDIARSVRSKGR
jgi:hypothetical protein